MDEKNQTPGRKLLVNIGALFIMLFVVAIILLPFASLGFFLEGYPTVGLILLVVFLVMLFITVFFFKNEKKKRLAREAEYRAENVTVYESAAGRLGVLQLEYDKNKNITTLRNGFPAIFSADEAPVLAVYGERAEGRMIEAAADRLLADRELIIEGIRRECEPQLSRELSGIKLDEIDIEDSGSSVFCCFSLKGDADYDDTAGVSYTVDKEGYRFKLI